jgi:hypothetical protein
MATFWLSFIDPDRPTGTQFLGVAVVDVTEAEMDAAKPSLLTRRAQFHLPPPEEDACWIHAAIVTAHRLGCNPGGEVATLRMDTHPRFPLVEGRFPRGRLLSRAELELLDVPPEEDAS